MTSTVGEQFSSEEEFDKIFSEAEANAKGDWEVDFVEMLGERFEKYGSKTYMSDKQYEILNRIAEGREYERK